MSAGEMGAGDPGDVELGVEGIGAATLVGEGDTGTVYRARHEASDRVVAVKVLRRRLDDAAERRFEERCRIVAELSRHPHVVAVHGAGVTSSGRPYVAMEYLPRGSLGERLARDGALDPDEVIDLGIKLAGGLGAIHRAGLVHGRLEPEDVLLSANGEPQLVDSGLVPSEHVTEDEADQADGTGGGVAGLGVDNAHAAPEVFAGQVPDARSDVYSLGSILCKVLAGTSPFDPEEESFHPLLDRVFVEEAADLRPPGVPDELWEVIERALADRAVRTPSADALAGDLEALKARRRQVGAAAASSAPGPDDDPSPRAPDRVLAPRRPVPGGRRRLVPAGTRARVAGVAALVVAVLGAVVVTWPDGTSPVTELGAAGSRSSTTIADTGPDRTEALVEDPPAVDEPPFSLPAPTTVVPTTVPTTAPRQVVEPMPTTVRRTVPTTSPPPPTTAPPPPRTTLPPPPPPLPEPTTETGTVIGCDSFGQRCNRVPVYRALPAPGTDPGTVATLATVNQGVDLRARCWSEGARVYNYDASEEPPDVGPAPYDSDVYYNVQVLGETWGWIADTYFVRDQGLKLGLPRC